jgi:hypothetical protein
VRCREIPSDDFSALQKYSSCGEPLVSDLKKKHKNSLRERRKNKPMEINRTNKNQWKSVKVMSNRRNLLGNPGEGDWALGYKLNGKTRSHPRRNSGTVAGEAGGLEQKERYHLFLEIATLS